MLLYKIQLVIASPNQVDQEIIFDKIKKFVSGLELESAIGMPSASWFLNGIDHLDQDVTLPLTETTQEELVNWLTSTDQVVHGGLFSRTSSDGRVTVTPKYNTPTEFIVEWKVKGVVDYDSSYYTDDWDDAVMTAHNMIEVYEKSCVLGSDKSKL
jgi:hypothetical protein